MSYGNTGQYFKDWMTQSIPYGKKLTMSGVGQITYASDVDLDCYTHGMTTKVVNDKGVEVVSTEQIYFVDINTTVLAIDYGDRFNMGTVIKPKYRPIKAISKFLDEDGVLDLVVIYLW